MQTAMDKEELDKKKRASALLKASRPLLAQGDLKNGLNNLLQAFVLVPDDDNIQTVLFDLLACVEGYNLPKDITEKLAIAALHSNKNTQVLASVLKNQLKYDETIIQLIETLETSETDVAFSEENLAVIDAVMSDQLLQFTAAKTICISNRLERLFCQLRRHALILQASDSDHKNDILLYLQGYLSIIACQCFSTEYVFSFSDEEKTLFEALSAKAISNPAETSNTEMIILACYMPLLNIIIHWNGTHVEELVGGSDSLSNWTLLMWQTTYKEPVKELVSKASISALSAITNPHSQATAQQRDAYPFPRWQSCNIQEPTPLRSILFDKYGQEIHDLFPSKNLSTFYAACGTGENVLHWESLISSEKSLAVDLSTMHIAYAQRKTEEYGLKNTHFAQADILTSHEWNASFDLIISGDSLHQIEKPIDGLKQLKSLCKSHSIIHISALSTIARQSAKAVRQFVKEKELPNTSEGIRKLRQHIKENSTNPEFREIQSSLEFYTMNGMHNYAFTQHENTFSPTELKQLLEEAGLSILGVEVKRTEIAESYLDQYPNDPALKNLENWEAFEKENPDTFDKMINIWACL